MVLLSHLYVFLITQWCHGSSWSCPACQVGRTFWDSSAALGAINEEKTGSFNSRVREKSEGEKWGELVEKIPPDLYLASNFLGTPWLGQLETCVACHHLWPLAALLCCCQHGYNSVMMLSLLLVRLGEKGVVRSLEKTLKSWGAVVLKAGKTLAYFYAMISV